MYLKYFITIIGVFFYCAGHAMTLVTEHYIVTITQHCPEGYVICDHVTYEGKSKKSGNSLKLKGETWHTYCADGVTPCRFLGYRFENGKYQYFVHDEGILQVLKDEGESLIYENGIWQQSIPAIPEQNLTCSYSEKKKFKLDSTAKLFTVNARYDESNCKEATLLIEINNSNNEVIYEHAIPFSLLNYYDEPSSSGARYAKRLISQITTPVSWPDYQYSNVEPGLSWDDQWQKIKSRQDLTESEKWDLLYSTEDEQQTTALFEISNQKFRDLQVSGARLFCFGYVEVQYMIAYDVSANKVIHVGQTCSSE